MNPHKYDVKILRINMLLQRYTLRFAAAVRINLYITIIFASPERHRPCGSATQRRISSLDPFESLKWDRRKIKNLSRYIFMGGLRFFIFSA